MPLSLRDMLSQVKKDNSVKQDKIEKEKIAHELEIKKVQDDVELSNSDVVVDNSPQQSSEESNSPLDAYAVVSVAIDKMDATLCIYSPKYGGADATLDQVKATILAEKIKYGIDEELLKEMISSKRYDQTVTIAKGTPAIYGVDAKIKPLIKIEINTKPQERGDGTVDYRELGIINTVSRDDRLCEIIAPTMGIEGSNVFGDTLRGMDGKAVAIPRGTNVGITEDGCYLIALCDGNVVFKDKKYSVDKLFVVKGDVDLSTGNIYFPGDVTVQGNVGEGFIVKADGNITIAGTVDSARIEAGGSVTVKAGCLNANVIVKGDELTVKFIESSTIYCVGVVKSDSIVNSSVFCEKIVEVIKKPGVIIGGETISLGGINALAIGSKNYTPTSIKVGDFAQNLEEIHQLESSVSILDDEISKYNQVIEFLQAKKAQNGGLEKDKEELLGSSLRLRIQKLSEKKRVAKQISEILDVKRETQYSVIICKDVIYPGVRVSINDSHLLTSTELKFCRLYETDGEIQIGIYA